jgi:tetratricopeptide (TPR) repeat protein
MIYIRWMFCLSALFLVSLLPAANSDIENILDRLSQWPAETTSRAKGVLYNDLGVFYWQAGEYQHATQAFERALLQPCGRRLRLDVYRRLARTYSALGRLDKAIEAQENAVSLDPRNWKRHRDVGGAYMRAQLYQPAAASYLQAIRLNKREPMLHFHAGQAFRMSHLLEEAEKCVLQSHEWGKRGPEWEHEMSLILEGQGRFAEALIHFQRVAAGPAPFQNKARLFYLALMAGRIDSAQQTLTQMKTSAPSPADLSLYEEVLKSFTDSPSRVLERRFSDPTLKALVSSL